MNNKKLIVAALLLPLLALAEVSPAFAKGVDLPDSPDAPNQVIVSAAKVKHAKKTHHKKVTHAKSVSGTLESFSTNTSFVLKSGKRGSVTVDVTTSTAFVGKKNAVLDPTNIQIGDKMTVYGTYDAKTKTVKNVTKVKDSSQE